MQLRPIYLCLQANGGGGVDHNSMDHSNSRTRDSGIRLRMHL